jgi:hypothetical protein
MTNSLKSFPKSPRSGRSLSNLLGIALAGGLLIGQPVLPGWTASHSEKAWPKRDFLPPVAAINPRMEEKTDTTSDSTVEAVSLAAIGSPVIHTTPKVDRLDTDLSGQFKTEQLQGVVEIQQKVDEADLEHLWQAAVEKNPVIRFSLEKLATPADLQTHQSSRFLTKTLSTMISGATMASTMLPGGGAYRNMASMAAGNALQNLTTGRTTPTPGSLSPTEQIQLASLIDDLKLKLIRTYQDYKNTLQNLAQAHEVTSKNNNMYSKALSAKNDLALMAAGTAYYQSLISETALRQKAKVYRLQLERLAGQDAVSTLELAVHVSDTDSATASTQPIIGPTPPEPSGNIPEPATASANPAVAMPLPLVGPAEPPIGPQPPTTSPRKAGRTTPSRTASKGKQASRQASRPMAMPMLELPQPMEIEPSLNAEIHAPMPLPQASNKTGATRGKNLAQSVSMPLPIPDKILEPKENAAP